MFKLIFLITIILASNSYGQNSLRLLAFKPLLMGGESSGGGGGFYCSGTDSTEALDLWEGRTVYGFEIPSSNENIKLQIERALINLELLAPYLVDNVRALVGPLIEESLALPLDVELAFPHDALPDFQKKNCKLAGLMFYDGDAKRVRFDSFLLSKLVSKTDEAALWLHEAIYKALRDNFGETNSKASRKVVACIFSVSGCFDKLKTLDQLLPIDRKIYQCYNKSVTYYYFESSQNRISFILVRAIGKELTYPAYNLDTIYLIPDRPTYQNMEISFSSTPKEISQENLKFQIFEKSNFEITMRSTNSPVSDREMRPVGNLGSAFDMNHEIFKIRESSNTCVEYP